MREERCDAMGCDEIRSEWSEVKYKIDMCWKLMEKKRSREEGRCAEG